MTAYQTTYARRLLRVAPVVVFSFLALLGCTSPALAQSTGAFSGAIVEVTPPRNADGSFKTINSILAGTTAGGTFYLEGNVFMNKTVRSDCTLPAGAEDLVNVSFVNKTLIFDGPGRRVGVYRMWGVLRNPANAGTTNAGGQSGDNISGSIVASVNMSIDLESFNATIQLQGTLGKVFGAIESAGHPLTDVLAITGGTGTLRSASGDVTLRPLTDANGVVCSSLGGFQVALQESPRFPRFGNVLPF